jgi:hypothetical protein
MTEPIRRKPPLPVALAFVACQEVYRDYRSGTWMLVGPTSHVPLTHFPAHVRLSVWAEVTGGHGSYQPRVCLLDGSDEVVWAWNPPAPLEQNNPLLPCQLAFHELMVAVPRLGKYRLVLLFNGEELAQRAMWFGPPQAFQA